MTRQDASEFERELGATLEGLAPSPAAGLLDRTLAEAVSTPQRRGWRAWSLTGDGGALSRWLAFGAVAAVAMLVGILIGSSRGLVAGDGPSPPPTPSVGTSESPTTLSWTEPASYTFVFVSDCGERNGLGTYDVTVKDGRATAFRPLDGGTATLDEMPTMGTLMSLVEDARGYLSSPSRPIPGPSGPLPRPSPEPAVVTLVTDPRDGHPTRIHIDWVPDAIDDEECYRITQYEPAASASPNPSAGPASQNPSAETATPSPSDGPAWTEPDSYVYTFDAQCGLRVLSGRWEVTVENGRPVDYRSIDHHGSQTLPVVEVPTLADLMHLVERARADADAVVRAFEVDPDDGHPTHIDIDWLPNAIDDEECYVIESYTPTD